MSTDSLLHPVVARWFTRTFGAPSECQSAGWPAIRAGRDTLIAAPTGSGKTLAAFLSVLDDLFREGLQQGGLPDETRIVYVSPLRALSNDIQKNLQEPLAGISTELAAAGLAPVEVRTMVRTGDTQARERNHMTRRPPHIVVTTPESLYILLTSEGGRRMLSTVRTVIVDEIHALVTNKRGAHLTLSLERLEALAKGGRPLRIGLSATQHPVETVAAFLVGGGGLNPEGVPRCSIIDSGHLRSLDLAVEVPDSPLEAVMSGEVWEEVYDRLAALIERERTTLVFVNTRRLAERLTRHLSERLGEKAVTSHHGSLSREHRLDAEQRLKSGALRALVATSSLELGIDIGAVDLVCQVGTTHSISAFLQRVGRSGHGLGRVPKGRIFPLSIDELVECAALFDGVRRGKLDRVTVPEAPLDILAQQMVATVASEDWQEDALFSVMRRAYPYRNLTRETFDEVAHMLWEGFSTRRGRRGAYLHRDAVHRRLSARRGARLAAITSGGAIPDNADYAVIQEPTGALVGSLNEDFAIESMQGDIFQLGNMSWRILRVEPGRVRVEDAKGQAPTIPFWLGEAPARTPELSQAVSRIRGLVDQKLASAMELSSGAAAAAEALCEQTGIGPVAADLIVEYLAAGRAALGAMPTLDTIVMERFFDESGGMQLVIHAPFGSRINRAWGLALRKRFCQRFNFELQAAATEDAILLSLGPSQSFVLEEVFDYLKPLSVRPLLVQALLVAPMFSTRWRWNASRALAVLRWRGGKKVPPRFQRMDADDLMAAVFPDSAACQDNLPGDREIPDHPLVGQTIHDCLEEAMDASAFERLLEDIHSGKKQRVARDLTGPSPFARQVLNARPYAFLDDAPLEERRTQAVLARRWLDPATASDLGALDAAAIQRVESEVWPQPQTPDELHDALVLLGFVTVEEGLREGWTGLFEPLARDGRAAELCAGAARLWIAAERLKELELIYPRASLTPHITPPADLRTTADSFETALVEVLRGRLESTGPVTAAELSRSAGLPVEPVQVALASLEGEGFVLRGGFTPGAAEEQWCERRLLARIHRYTLTRLRSEIEPVSAADFMGFLLEWQRLSAVRRMQGPDALSAVLGQLEGFQAPAAAWEGEILPARVKDYDPSWLDTLCLSGRIVWARLTPSAPAPGTKRAGPVRATPIALLPRSSQAVWAYRSDPSAPLELSARADSVLHHLQRSGASFFQEMVAAAHCPRTEVEEGLAELVSAGLATSDSFSGLRALLAPSNQRRPLVARRKRGRVAELGMESAGRWALLERPGEPTADSRPDAAAIEHVARALLRRYGVVFHRILERESVPHPWRDLLRVFYRLEARGEVRGGRFVAGFAGQQFALSEAVTLLRSTRRRDKRGELVSMSAADPLNLVGLITPGERVPALTSNRICLRDGIPIACKVGDDVRFLIELEPPQRWEATSVLLRRTVPQQLKAYLGKSA